MPDSTQITPHAIRIAISEGRMADADAMGAAFAAQHPGEFEPSLLWCVLMVKSQRPFMAEPVLRELIGKNPKSVEARFWLAKIMSDSLRFTEAKELLESALRVDPNSADALVGLARHYIREWRNELANPLIERALLENPAFAPGVVARGLVEYHEGRTVEGEQSFRHAIEFDAYDPEPYAFLGRMLVSRGAEGEAGLIFEQAHKQFWISASKLVDFAETCASVGNLEQSERAFNRALELEPNVTPTRRNLGHLLLEEGKFEQAEAEYRAAIELDPNVPILYHELVLCRKFEETDRPILEQIRAMLRSPRFNGREKRELHFALGRAYDDLAEYGKAMQHYDEANALDLQQYKPFDRAAHTKLVDKAADSFTTSLFKRYRNLGNESNQPIFVIGMMRSGTTLTDQIVTAHPMVGGAGELTFLREHRTDVFDPGAQPDPEKIAAWATTYLNLVGVTAPNFQRVTDKLPSNFLIAGLIHLAFPNAKFIHCRRNPLDTCLSIYCTTVAANYAQRFSDIAFYYREYVRLMAHWRRVLPEDRLFELDYEDLVANREPVVRDLLEFLELPWDEAVLSHEQSKGVVSTPSMRQARQPIYTSSVERWRRYKPWIGELLAEFPTLAD